MSKRSVHVTFAVQNPRGMLIKVIVCQKVLNKYPKRLLMPAKNTGQNHFCERRTEFIELKVT